MNILLVYPEMPDTFYAMKHMLRMSGKKAVYPPLGLMTVASLLPGDWPRKLVDLNVSPLSQKDLEWADFVFLSAMNVQENSVREIIELCRKSGVRIVAGGTLFTHEHSRFPGIDIFVLNEAEITLPLFLEDLARGELKPIYRSPDFAEITQSPIPSFDLVNIDDYLYSILQYSRGCPHMCDFCDVTTLYGRRPRIKSTSRIIEELNEIIDQGRVRLVLFADDNLIGNKRVLKEELLPALIAWRREKLPSFLFATQLTIDLADIHKLHRSGFYVAGGFIVGFDTDTPSIFQRQADFIQQSGIPLPIVNLLKAPPGTELYKRMEKEGRLKNQFAFSEALSNIKPLMEEKVLQEGFMELLDNIYLPKNSYKRLITFFSTYRYPRPFIKVPSKISFRDLTMVVRVLFLLGITDPHRQYFWKLLFWLVRHNYKYLDMGLFYGMMMYQMHQTSLHLQHANTNIDSLINTQ
jgi:radical SAM superfamily enzyme YgiQ (UPF0313 family)